MKAIDRTCENCVRRKTPYCPNSKLCYDILYLPYFQDRITLLKENEKLFNNWTKLREWLKKELGDRTNPNKDKWLTGVYDAYKETIDKMQELQGRDNNE